MSGIDKLKHLRLLVQVHRMGSFASAAQSLGMAPSSISKSIQRLEKEIDLTLIERTTRTLSFTLAGNHYVSMANDILNQLDTTESHLQHSQKQASGTLNINVPVSYGRLYILPLIPQFTARYPNINVNLTFSDRYADIVKDNIDVCIRTGTLKDSGLIAKKLSPIDFVTCAAPAYIQANKNAIEDEDWEKLNWVKFRYKQSGKVLPVCHPSRENIELNAMSETVVDDGEAMMSLCESGVGLTQVPHFIARKWLNDNSIQILGTTFRSKQEGVYAMYPSRNPAERTQLLIKFLQQQLAQWGEGPEYTWALDRDHQPINSF